MGGLDGYKGPDIKEDLGGIQDVPQSFETQKTDIDSESSSVKDQLGDLKQHITSNDIQKNNKIEETIDTFDEQLGKILSNEEKQDFSKLLKDSADKSSSSKLFLDKVTTYLKSYGNDILKTDLQDIIGMVLVEEEVLEKKDEKLKKSEEELKKSEEELKKSEEELKQKGELLKQKQNLNNLNNSLEGLSVDNVHYGDIVKKVNELINGDFDKVKYDEIINLLKDDNTLLYILDDLKEKSPEQYSSFRVTLIDMNQGFEKKLDSYDSGILGDQQKLVTGFTSINGMDISSQVLKQKTGDGFNVEVGKEGRKLSMEGSEYQLGSKIDVRDDIIKVREIEKEMKQEVSGLNKTLNSIQGLKKYVNESIVNKIDIKEVKQNIKNADPDLYNELQLDLVTSLEQVIQGLDYLYNKTEKEKDGILKKIKQRVDEIVFKNAEEAKEKDKNKKETLKALHKNSFDLLPKEVSDAVISRINSGNLFKLLGFQSNIDIENGNLGTNFDNDKNKISIKEIQKFTEIMNIMITGSKDYPVVIDSLTSIGKPNFVDKEGKLFSDDKMPMFISNQLGANPKSQAILNLENYLSTRNDNNKNESK